jgi:hypothetical protein
VNQSISQALKRPAPYRRLSHARRRKTEASQPSHESEYDWEIVPDAEPLLFDEANPSPEPNVYVDSDIDSNPSPEPDTDSDAEPDTDSDSEPGDVQEGSNIWTPQLEAQNRALEEEAAESIAWEAPTSKSPMSTFLFAFAVWCDRANISRSDYAALLEVIQLARDTPEVWKQLPKTLDTLQNRYQAQIPTSPIYEREIDLRLDKMPTGSGAGKVYFFDPIELTKTILRSNMRQHMHFGMAQLVDEASELWHGEAWAESIRTCSGEFARYPNGTPPYQIEL